MLQLCSGKNKEGYLHALFKSFSANDAPAKSSLSKMRKKVSYSFFRDALTDLLSTFKRPTWRGLHLYATDGFEAAIPRTESTFGAGYRGKRMRSKGKKGETYYPHLYTVHSYDVLSRTTKSICFGPKNNEIAGAMMNIPEFEKNSLVMYDRGFSAVKVMRATFEHGSYFLIRCRKDKFGVPKEIRDFIRSGKKRDSFLLEGYAERRVYLYKIEGRKRKETLYLATNKKDLGIKTVEELYWLRWEVENSFRDLVESLRIEQWHSKDINGIYQELYMRLWIMNFARIHQFEIEKRDKNPLARIYKRSNFKLVLDFFIVHWREIFDRSKKVLRDLKIIILRSTEERKHRSRSKPRQIRFNPSNYTAANIIFDEVQA